MLTGNQTMLMIENIAVGLVAGRAIDPGLPVLGIKEIHSIGRDITEDDDALIPVPDRTLDKLKAVRTVAERLIADNALQSCIDYRKMVHDDFFPLLSCLQQEVVLNKVVTVVDDLFCQLFRLLESRIVLGARNPFSAQFLALESKLEVKLIAV